MAKEGSGGEKKDRNLIRVQVLHLRGLHGGDGEQPPRQCAGTSFISAHSLCSHSSLTPLTDELQRLAKLPAESAPAHAPSALSSATLLQHFSLHLASGGGGYEVTWRSRVYGQEELER